MKWQTASKAFLMSKTIETVIFCLIRAELTIYQKIEMAMLVDLLLQLNKYVCYKAASLLDWPERNCQCHSMPLDIGASIARLLVALLMQHHLQS